MMMMMARKQFVIKSMMVMPIPSQNRINPRSRFKSSHPFFFPCFHFGDSMRAQTVQYLSIILCGKCINVRFFRNIL